MLNQEQARLEDLKKQLREAEEELRWSRFLVKSPEWGRLADIVRDNVRGFATKGNAPIEAKAEVLQISGSNVVVPVDAQTQLLQREYFKGVHFGMMSVIDAPARVLEVAEEEVKRLRAQVDVAEKMLAESSKEEN